VNKPYETGRAFELEVAALARDLGFDVLGQLRLGARVWGAPRRIDLSLGYPGRPFLGIECKFQGSRGSIEEKCIATLVDMDTWPIDGIMTWTGGGYSLHFREWLMKQPNAVHFDNLPEWLESWKADEQPK